MLFPKKILTNIGSYYHSFKHLHTEIKKILTNIGSYYHSFKHLHTEITTVHTEVLKSQNFNFIMKQTRVGTPNSTAITSFFSQITPCARHVPQAKGMPTYVTTLDHDH